MLNVKFKVPEDTKEKHYFRFWNKLKWPVKLHWRNKWDQWKETLVAPVKDLKTKVEKFEEKKEPIENQDHKEIIEAKTSYWAH